MQITHKQSLYPITHLITKTIHLGHKKIRRNQNNNNVIVGTRNKIDIIDLNETIKNLNKITPIILSTLTNNGKLLIINLNDDFTAFRSTTLQEITTKKWFPGTFSNFKVVQDKVHFKILPNLTFQITAQPDYAITRETKSLNLPLIAVTDTTTDIKEYNYPIPGNDDSLTAQKFYINYIKQLCFLSYLTKQIKRKTQAKKHFFKRLKRITS